MFALRSFFVGFFFSPTSLDLLLEFYWSAKQFVSLVFFLFFYHYNKSMPFSHSFAVFLVPGLEVQLSCLRSEGLFSTVAVCHFMLCCQLNGRSGVMGQPAVLVCSPSFLCGPVSVGIQMDVHVFLRECV